MLLAKRKLLALSLPLQFASNRNQMQLLLANCKFLNESLID